MVVKEKKTRPVTRMEKTTMKKYVFFKLAESDADKASGIDAAIKDAADMMKLSDDATFTITGYADKGTGSAKSNKKFAKKRADDVAKKLINEYGLDASRLKTDSKGDAVQPFPEDNDKNRCVIITGKGTFKITTMEEYEVEKTVMHKVKKAVVRQKEVQELVK